MSDHITHRCSCRGPQGRPYGTGCPRLHNPDGTPNPGHGTWRLQMELPPTAAGKRRPLRRNYPTKTDAARAAERIRTILNHADHDDPDTRRVLADLIEQVLAAHKRLPTDDEIDRKLRTGNAIAPTVSEWLTEWLARRRRIRPGTYASYASHLRQHLIPHLGHIRLDKLTAIHIGDMFDAIEERSQQLRQARATNDPATLRKLRGQRITGPATQHRIRATLRAALNAAIVAGHRTTNPAQHLEMTPTRRPAGMLWTKPRVAAWRATGTTPCPVMVWTPEQLGRFLDTAASHRLYPLYLLIAHRGLRRGEACGIHDTDLDLDNNILAVRWQIVQDGTWTPHLAPTKTPSSDGLVALDTLTTTAIRHYLAVRARDQLAAGAAWPHTGLLFVTPHGNALHPAEVTDTFHQLRRQADLPPIRLHDLRHGAATLALAAGADIATVSKMLRHSSITITADTYTNILPATARSTAENITKLIPRTATR